MKKFITIVFVIFFVAMASACDIQNGCNDSVPEIHQLTEANSGYLIRIKQFDQILIKLESNPSTGYSWANETSPGDVVEQDGESDFESKCDAPGCGGTETFSFTAVGTGTQKITLTYKRSWEDDSEPIKQFEVTVAAH